MRRAESKQSFDAPKSTTKLSVRSAKLGIPNTLAIWLSNEYYHFRSILFDAKCNLKGKLFALQGALKSPSHELN